MVTTGLQGVLLRTLDFNLGCSGGANKELGAGTDVITFDLKGYWLIFIVIGCVCSLGVFARSGDLKHLSVVIRLTLVVA